MGNYLLSPTATTTTTRHLLTLNRRSSLPMWVGRRLFYVCTQFTFSIDMVWWSLGLVWVHCHSSWSIQSIETSRRYTNLLEGWCIDQVKTQRHVTKLCQWWLIVSYGGGGEAAAKKLDEARSDTRSTWTYPFAKVVSLSPCQFIHFIYHSLSILVNESVHDNSIMDWLGYSSVKFWENPAKYTFSEGAAAASPRWIPLRGLLTTHDRSLMAFQETDNWTTLCWPAHPPLKWKS